MGVSWPATPNINFILWDEKRTQNPTFYPDRAVGKLPACVSHQRGHLAIDTLHLREHPSHTGGYPLIPRLYYDYEYIEYYY